MADLDDEFLKFQAELEVAEMAAKAVRAERSCLALYRAALLRGECVRLRAACCCGHVPNLCSSM